MIKLASTKRHWELSVRERERERESIVWERVFGWVGKTCVDVSKRKDLIKETVL